MSDRSTSKTAPQPGEGTLNLLKNLDGVWKSSGNGWNMIALPSSSSNLGYRLLLNQYDETLKFTVLEDKKIPNRGISGDQFVAALDYEQTITQRAEASFSSAGKNEEVSSPETDSLNPPDIHHEAGLWLQMYTMKEEEAVEGFLARLATIPHGNSVLALGKRFEFPKVKGSFRIPEISGLPINTSPGVLDLKKFLVLNKLSDLEEHLPLKTLSAILPLEKLSDLEKHFPLMTLSDLKKHLPLETLSDLEIHLPLKTLPDLEKLGGYLAPYGKFHKEKFKGKEKFKDEEGFTPVNPNQLLDEANKKKSISSITMLHVDTAVKPIDKKTVVGGIINIPFITKQANATRMTSTFWIQTVTGSAEPTRLQYTQTVLLEFDGLLWPHVSINTLEKE